MITEIELTGYLLGEIINHRSNDYLQTYYFTHKCTDGANVIWYKSHAEYVVQNTSSLWFKESEIEWLEGLDEND